MYVEMIFLRTRAFLTSSLTGKNIFDFILLGLRWVLNNRNDTKSLDIQGESDISFGEVYFFD